ncbi:aldo-keto reductase family 1 member B1 [Diachasma alloeum]|uniref:aldo-keto reductase family 1 member B1 n=1 Tax=Diachasma alloeum TaxID=454923 RepID=UPI00073814BA|nr:aldo-keto reductase family 1 member B1 [Diachasma alloeum]XP_015121683.1 aldo-keto reductase family 1 member B1 [Diachasma alloeum]
MSLAPKLKFYNGCEIPVLGLGTWKSKPGEVGQAVRDAIDIGYRHIDCALAYGNESEVGEAIRDKISQGVVKREDLFITSKLFNNYHKFESVEKGIRKTLGNLGLEYLDLYLIHWPVAHEDGDELFPKNPDGSIKLADIDYLETWRGMELVHGKGLTRNIGVSNFNSEQISRLLENCKIRPLINQVECHPYLTQQRLSKFCKDKNIIITAYCPLGSPDRPWARPEDPKLLDDKNLLKISQKYKKTPAQVVIRYQIDRGHVVIPKTVTKSRLLENFQVFDFKLSPEDISYINSLDVNGRLCALADRKASPYYPFHIDF